MSVDESIFQCMRGPMDGEWSNMEHASGDTLIRGISRSTYVFDDYKQFYWKWTPKGQRPEAMAVYHFREQRWMYSTMRAA
jgi:hypothetical protein